MEEDDDELEVFIMPNDNSGDNDDFDDDGESEGIQQGRDIDSFSVMKGERFKTESQFTSWVENDEKKYKLVKRIPHGSFETLDTSNHLDLEPGNYLFHDDGVTIEQLYVK